MQALVFSLFLSDSGGELLSARGMARMSESKVAALMQLDSHMMTETPHPTLGPAVMVGERGGEICEFVGRVKAVINQTGGALINAGFKDLGGFMVAALEESAGDVEVLLEKVGRPRSFILGNVTDRSLP